MKISDAVLELKSADMERVVGEVAGLSVGRNHKTVCIFCGSGNRKGGTPAFHVYPHNFRCYSCNKHGDVVDFVQEHMKLEFVDAVRYLASMFGIVIDDDEEEYRGPCLIDFQVGQEIVFDRSKNSAAIRDKFIKVVDLLKFNGNFVEFDEIFEWQLELTGSESRQIECGMPKGDVPFKKRFEEYVRLHNDVLNDRKHRAKCIMTARIQLERITFNDPEWLPMATYICEQVLS